MVNGKKTYVLVGVTIAATMLNGFLTGGNVDRSFVAMPAWQQVGFATWATFSRHADLGTGQLLYPFMAFGGTLLTLLAAILVKTTGTQRWKRILPFFLAAICMVVSLPFSFKATPFMLSLRHIDNQNTVVLQQAFLGFEYWGRLQGFFHLVAFCCNLWSLIVIFSL